MTNENKKKEHKNKVTAPPDLTIRNLSFLEPSGNNVLDGYEKGEIIFNVENIGKGIAYGVKVDVQNMSREKELLLDQEVILHDIKPGDVKNVSVILRELKGVGTSEILLVISVNELNGFDADDINFTFSTVEFKPLKFVLVNAGISDDGSNESKGNGNYKIEPSEIIEVTAFLQNKGYGIANNVKAELKIGDSNIFLLSEKSSFDFEIVEPGDYKSIHFTLTVNKRFNNTELPISFVITESTGDYGMNFALQKGMKSIEILNLIA